MTDLEAQVPPTFNNKNNVPKRAETMPTPSGGTKITRGNYLSGRWNYDMSTAAAAALNKEMKQRKNDFFSGCLMLCVGCLLMCVILTIAGIIGWQVSIAVEQSGETIVVAVVLAIFTAFASCGCMITCCTCCCYNVASLTR